MSISYSFTVTTPKPAEEVYDYLADLHNLPEWDPETIDVKQTSEGEADRVGATFRLRAGRTFMNRTMDYEILELERPHRIVARGDSSSGGGVDTLTISPTSDGGSEVAYLSEIALKGIIGKLAGPFASASVQRSGQRTRDGLERTLNSD